MEINNKYIYEKLIIPENKIEGGWYSEEYGFCSIPQIEELKLIQNELIKFCFNCTLVEAEAFWSSYSQNEHYATWINYDGILPEEAIIYAQTYFKDNQSSD